jgi:hypothetical protein
VGGWQPCVLSRSKRVCLLKTRVPFGRSLGGAAVPHWAALFGPVLCSEQLQCCLGFTEGPKAIRVCLLALCLFRRVVPVVAVDRHRHSGFLAAALACSRRAYVVAVARAQAVAFCCLRIGIEPMGAAAAWCTFHTSWHTMGEVVIGGTTASRILGGLLLPSALIPWVGPVGVHCWQCQSCCQQQQQQQPVLSVACVHTAGKSVACLLCKFVQCCKSKCVCDKG